MNLRQFRIISLIRILFFYFFHIFFALKIIHETRSVYLILYLLSPSLSYFFCLLHICTQILSLFFHVFWFLSVQIYAYKTKSKRIWNNCVLVFSPRKKIVVTKKIHQIYRINLTKGSPTFIEITIFNWLIHFF